MRVARYVIPRNSVAKMLPIQTSVMTAFRDSGGLKFGTPLAIASLPVRPTEPEANARRTSSAVSGSMPSVWNASRGSTATGMSPEAMRNSP